MKLQRQTPSAPREFWMVKKHIDAMMQFWQWIYEATDRAVYKYLTRPRIGDTRPSEGGVVYKPRDHFRMDGEPKVNRTEAGAKLFCEEHEGYRYYRCSICGNFHVGHKPVAA